MNTKSYKVMKKFLPYILGIVATLALMWMFCVEEPGILDVAIPAILVIASVKTLEGLEPTDNKA